MYDEYLAHHGIKGMRWGVRRYQNEDGSLTGAGKKRYYATDRGGTARERRENVKAAYRQRRYDLKNNKIPRQLTQTQTKKYQEALSKNTNPIESKIRASVKAGLGVAMLYAGVFGRRATIPFKRGSNEYVVTLGSKYTDAVLGVAGAYLMTDAGQKFRDENARR